MSNQININESHSKATTSCEQGSINNCVTDIVSEGFVGSSVVLNQNTYQTQNNVLNLINQIGFERFVGVWHNCQMDIDDGSETYPTCNEGCICKDYYRCSECFDKVRPIEGPASVDEALSGEKVIGSEPVAVEVSSHVGSIPSGQLPVVLGKRKYNFNPDHHSRYPVDQPPPCHGKRKIRAAKIAKKEVDSKIIHKGFYKGENLKTDAQVPERYFIIIVYGSTTLNYETDCSTVYMRDIYHYMDEYVTGNFNITYCGEVCPIDSILTVLPYTIFKVHKLVELNQYLYNPETDGVDIVEYPSASSYFVVHEKSKVIILKDLTIHRLDLKSCVSLRIDLPEDKFYIKYPRGVSRDDGTVVLNGGTVLDICIRGLGGSSDADLEQIEAELKDYFADLPRRGVGRDKKEKEEGADRRIRNKQRQTFKKNKITNEINRGLAALPLDMVEEDPNWPKDAKGKITKLVLLAREIKNPSVRVQMLSAGLDGRPAFYISGRRYIVDPLSYEAWGKRVNSAEAFARYIGELTDAGLPKEKVYLSDNLKPGEEKLEEIKPTAEEKKEAEFFANSFSKAPLSAQLPKIADGDIKTLAAVIDAKQKEFEDVDQSDPLIQELTDSIQQALKYVVSTLPNHKNVMELIDEADAREEIKELLKGEVTTLLEPYVEYEVEGLIDDVLGIAKVDAWPKGYRVGYRHVDGLNYILAEKQGDGGLIRDQKLFDKYKGEELRILNQILAAIEIKDPNTDFLYNLRHVAPGTFDLWNDAIASVFTGTPGLGNFTGLGHSNWDKNPVNESDLVAAFHDSGFPFSREGEKVFANLFEASGAPPGFGNLIETYLGWRGFGDDKFDEDNHIGTLSFNPGILGGGGFKDGAYYGDIVETDVIEFAKAVNYDELKKGEGSTTWTPSHYARHIADSYSQPPYVLSQTTDGYAAQVNTMAYNGGLSVIPNVQGSVAIPYAQINCFLRGWAGFNADIPGGGLQAAKCIQHQEQLIEERPLDPVPMVWAPPWASFNYIKPGTSWNELGTQNKMSQAVTPYGALPAVATFIADLNITTDRLFCRTELLFFRALKYWCMSNLTSRFNYVRGGLVADYGGIADPRSGGVCYTEGTIQPNQLSEAGRPNQLPNILIMNINEWNTNLAAYAAVGVDIRLIRQGAVQYLMWSKTNGGSYQSDVLQDFVYKMIMVMGTDQVPQLRYDIALNQNRVNTNDIPNPGVQFSYIFDYCGLIRENNRAQYLIILTDALPGDDSGIYAGTLAQPLVGPGANLLVMSPAAPVVYDYEDFVGTWYPELTGQNGYSIISKIAQQINCVPALNNALSFVIHNTAGIPVETIPVYVQTDVGGTNPAPQAASPNYPVMDNVRGVSLINDTYYNTPAGIPQRASLNNTGGGANLNEYASGERGIQHWCFPKRWGNEWMLLSGLTTAVADGPQTPFKLSAKELMYSRMWGAVMRHAATGAICDYLQVPKGIYWGVPTDSQLPSPVMRMNDFSGFGKGLKMMFGPRFLSAMTGCNLMQYGNYIFCDRNAIVTVFGANVTANNEQGVLNLAVDPFVLSVCCKKVPLVYAPARNLSGGPAFPFFVENKDFKRLRRNIAGILYNTFQTYVQSAGQTMPFDTTQKYFDYLRAQVAFISSNYLGALQATFPDFGSNGGFLNWLYGNHRIIKRPFVRSEGFLAANGRIWPVCSFSSDKLFYSMVSMYYIEWVPITVRLTGDITRIDFSWAMGKQAELYRTSRQTDDAANENAWDMLINIGPDTPSAAVRISEMEGTTSVAPTEVPT